MDLVRDVLDKKIVDRHGREMGRVDSVILEVRDDGPPVVIAIELGPAVLAERVHLLCGRWMAALELALGIAAGRPLRIPFADVITIQDHIKVDRAFGETAAATVEQRLRAVVGAIPGSS
jgi:sporulation protein YlmC with PRC-barrel domain